MSERNLPNLDKIFKDEDEPDFKPSGGSNLAAIFGVMPKPELTNKQSVQKKLNTTSNASHNNQAPKVEVIITKVIDGFKLVTGKYVPVGKLGIALIGNVLTKGYQLILYRSKQEYLSVVTVTCDFLYTIHGNNYASYYDNNKENWSILFDNNQSSIEFAREVGLSKYFCRQPASEHSVIYQDLSPVQEGNIAKQWDFIDLKYFISTEIKQPFKLDQISFQTMRVQISTDDNWERTLLGISKGTKRVLFLNPSKQISLGPGFPKLVDVMLEIEIMDLETPSEDPTVKPVISNKASILSRMEKMGQAILPRLHTSTTTDSDDTEEDIPHRLPKHKKAELSTSVQKKYTVQERASELSQNADIKSNIGTSEDYSTNKPVIPSSALLSPCSSTRAQSHYATSDCPMYSYLLQNNSLQAQAVMDPTLNMMLSETRMANAEIRMGMSKIADNVQKLLDKLHSMELQNATTPSSEKTMETTLKMMLAMNMSRSSIKDCEALPKKDEENNTLKNVQEFVKHENENSASPNRKELSSITEQYHNSIAEKEELLHVNETLIKNMGTLEALVKDSNDLFKKALDNLEDTRRLVKENVEENAAFRDKMQEIIAEFNTIKSCILLSKQKDNEKKVKEVKKIMTETYHSLTQNFKEGSYTSSYINSSIADTIRDITLKVLDGGSTEDYQMAKGLVSDTSQSISKHSQKVADTLSASGVAESASSTEFPENKRSSDEASAGNISD